MDLEKALQFAETYARGYLSYLLAFFGEPGPAPTGEEPADPFKTTVLFAILSCFLGAVFSTRALSGLFPHQGDVLMRMSEELAYWFALAFLLYLILRISGAPKVGLDVLLVVLTVTPVAYAMAGFGSYMIANVSLAVTTNKVLIQKLTYGSDVLIQIGVSMFYFPRYLTRVPGLARWRAWAGVVVLVLTIILVQLVYLVLMSNKARADAEHQAACAAVADKPAAIQGALGCKP